MFEFLFKYRPLIFERGDFVFGAPWYLYVLAVGVVAVAVPTVLLYGRAKGRSGTVDRVLLSVIRSAVLALVLFSLFRPALVLSTVVPQRNFVGVLLDDSRSMRIADVEATPRGGFIHEQFAAETGQLLKALSERFIVRFFRFSAGAERANDVSELAFTGGKSDIGRALSHAQQELTSVPLAGLVLVTDGADNSFEPLDETLLALQARSVPVHTVGLGRETFSRDIELTRVETPRSVLNGTSLVVDLIVTQRGYHGATVPLVVEDDGRIVNTQDVTLPGDGEGVPVRVHFTVTEPGPRLFTFRIPEQPGEMVAQNNEQEALIVVEDRREKILYFEGEPRFEVKFMSRAVADDDNIQLVILVRTAENKFYRRQVDDESELFGGFPKTREELFAYRAIILGSVEASFFTHDQLQMIADFVSQRGGGLLMLGGRRAFARGGWAGTPVEDVLPVVLDPTGGDDDFIAEVHVEPTPSGLTHPATQIAPTERESAERWGELPAVTVVNRVSEIKPGATTLLRGLSDDLDDPQVVLAWQRYGRGKVLVLPIQDSWTWQMHADIPVDDLTHETLWQQLLRWLVSYVPDRVSVTTPADRVAPAEAVEVVAEVEDDTYLRVNNTEVVGHVTSPSGVERSIPMDWTVEEDGEYRMAFVPDEHGLYQIDVEAREGGEFIESTASYVQVTDLAREYYDAEMRKSLLDRIAEETGGGSYTPETVSALAEDITYTESGTTVVEERDLWDMPIVFFLLVGFLSAEWGYRRLRGLV